MLKHKNDEIILFLTLLLLVSNLCWLMSQKKVKECKITRSVKKNIQIFVLAGQSNMAGRGGVTKKVVDGNVTKVWNGFVPQECKPNRKIIRFNVAQKWEEAHEPLNYGIDCLASCGLGPGMAFANEILKKNANFGVIGLVPCARGGTSLYKWIRGSFSYDELVKRAKFAEKDGGIIRGLLWYHGESDVKGGNGYKDYKINLEKFIHNLRSDLNSPNLPILQVVLPYPKKPFKGPYIEEVRAAQLAINISNVIKIDAKGLEIGPDGIHLTTTAQVQLGLQTNDRRASIGFAALDSFGRLPHAHRSLIQYVGKAMITEAIAIRKTFECAISNVWKNVKIFSDVKNVVDMIQKRVTASWMIEVTFEDI